MSPTFTLLVGTCLVTTAAYFRRASKPDMSVNATKKSVISGTAEEFHRAVRKLAGLRNGTPCLLHKEGPKYEIHMPEGVPLDEQGLKFRTSDFGPEALSTGPCGQDGEESDEPAGMNGPEGQTATEEVLHEALTLWMTEFNSEFTNDLKKGCHALANFGVKKDDPKDDKKIDFQEFHDWTMTDKPFDNRVTSDYILQGMFDLVKNEDGEVEMTEEECEDSLKKWNDKLLKK